MIGIIDYGMSNLRSVKNALDYLNYTNEIVANPSEITKYDKLILPGVGAFGQAMERINNTGFADKIKEQALVKKVPILGICLGMQLLLETSTEKGFHKGLGLIKGDVKFLGDKISHLPIPHIGWNTLIPKSGSRMFNDLDQTDSSFYFVHSYYCDVLDKNLVSGTVNYGFTFDVAIENDSIFAFQFHPEKSQKNGLKLLQKFVKL